MVVQHNLQAMNANRMLNITTGSQSKSAEKLSSGYRINRAADDAAGLSISEKMRKQIRGLDQASTNAEDGVSAVQTAEGALTEVHSMLQRMNQLAVQSANGTNSETDRKAIQDEIDQLTKEIDRVSETTKFNETYLLKGDGTETVKETVKVEAAAGVDVKASYVAGKGVEKVQKKQAAAFPTTWYAKGSATALSSDELMNMLEVKGGKVALKDGVEIFKAAANTNNQFGAQLKDDKVASMAVLSEENRRMQEMMKMYGMGGMDASMFGSQATLVLNANHPLVQFLVANKDSKNVSIICKQLYDLAMLAHKPLSPEEMTAFVKRSNDIMMLLTK